LSKNALFGFYPVLAWPYKLKFFSMANLFSDGAEKKHTKIVRPTKNVWDF